MTTSVLDHPSPATDSPSDPEQASDAALGVETPTDTPSQDSDPAADATSDTASPDDGDVISNDVFEALKGDPDKLRREMNRAFTQKTQRLASERKDLHLGGDLVQALRANPRGTLEQLARNAGFDLIDRSAEASQAQTAASVADEVTQIIRDQLGEDYSDLAERLGPAIATAADKVVGQRTKALETRQAQLVQESALRESEAVLATFGKTHPDWKKHEPAMLALTQKIEPKGMTELEYLDTLYTLVTKDRKVGDEVKQTISRMSASTRATDSRPGIGADKVAERPARPPTFKEAAAAARRGVRFE